MDLFGFDPMVFPIYLGPGVGRWTIAKLPSACNNPHSNLCTHCFVGDPAVARLLRIATVDLAMKSYDEVSRN